MPRTAKTELEIAVEVPGYTARMVDLDGYTVAYETFTEDQDPAQLFVGLPDDRCQSPHWGVVLSGQVVFRFADHDETYRAGDAYYAPPGHLPLVSQGTETIEFSPTDLLGETLAVVGQNLAALSTDVSA
jgi:hypothetical protein